MSRDLQQRRDQEVQMKAGANVDVDAEHNPEVSRRASNAGLRREEQIHSLAAAGTQGAGSKLPHYDQIQASFGKHDISHIQAHTGAQAEGASRAMGAEAYAQGNNVAFAGTPDLHTAAHEAAHVIQQQQGVQLKGGVGAAGDAYEQQADAVADRVVQGKSAEDLLGAPGAAKSEGGAVQRKGKGEDKPVDKDKAHGAAATMSNGGVQASLKYMAFELNAWVGALREQMAPGPTNEAGAEPQIQTIEGIYDKALTDVMRVSELIGTINKDERRYFAAEVKQVQGMANRFLPVMNQAANWIKSQVGHGQDKLLDYRQIQQVVDGLTARIGIEEKMEIDRTAPEGDDDHLRAEVAVAELDALEASVVSLEAGNAEDASRVTMHARYLHNFAKDHLIQFKSKGKHKQVLDLQNKLKKIHKEKPELNLGEALNHIAALAKTN